MYFTDNWCPLSLAFDVIGHGWAVAGEGSSKKALREIEETGSGGSQALNGLGSQRIRPAPTSKSRVICPMIENGTFPKSVSQQRMAWGRWGP
jgi:hypothetical protein